MKGRVVGPKGRSNDGFVKSFVVLLPTEPFPLMVTGKMCWLISDTIAWEGCDIFKG